MAASVGVKSQLTKQGDAIQTFFFLNCCVFVREEHFSGITSRVVVVFDPV